MIKEGFQQAFQEKIRKIESALKEAFPLWQDARDEMIHAEAYSIQAGGKRLRPVFMMAAYELFGGKDERILPFAMAMEMIHTFSLVHDDLPAMDNDELRRGKPTAWKRYGEGMALLAGDSLLVRAVSTALGADSSLGSDRKIRALSVLMKKTGADGMMGGQAIDLMETGHKPSEETLELLYVGKTSALIEASLMVGAILAGASDEEVRVMESVGRKTGVAFQIRDDILDMISTDEELGKKTGSDEKNQKHTLGMLLGLEEAEKRVRALSTESMELLQGLKKDTAFLQELIESLIDRKK